MSRCAARETIGGRRQTLLRERDVGSPSCNPSPRFVDELLVVLAWAESAQRHDWCAGENHQPENVGLAVTLQAAGLEALSRLEPVAKAQTPKKL